MAEAKTYSRIWLKNVIISFAPGVFTASAAQGSTKEKYNCAALIEKNDTANLKLLSDAVVNAAQIKWPSNFQERLAELKAADRLPLHNGDGKASKAGYKGRFYINASNDIRPLVLDANKTPLTAADGKPYSGSIVNLFVEIWAQDNKHGKRINASLLGVQFVRDGERLAGGSVATADDFEAIPGSETPDGGVNAEQTDPSALFE